MLSVLPALPLHPWLPHYRLYTLILVICASYKPARTLAGEYEASWRCENTFCRGNNARWQVN